LRPQWLVALLYLLPHDVYVAPLCCVTPLPVLSELLACLSLPRSVPMLLPAKLLMPLRQLAWWRILRLLTLIWLLSAPMKPARIQTKAGDIVATKRQQVDAVTRMSRAPSGCSCGCGCSLHL
jgi:hypothetical protein